MLGSSSAVSGIGWHRYSSNDKSSVAVHLCIENKGDMSDRSLRLNKTQVNGLELNGKLEIGPGFLRRNHATKKLYPLLGYAAKGHRDVRPLVW